ncbi:MAG: AraC family transcriptional regulator [Planctomyces sp.]|nr:AraC family transcriptional regulator [Planctomyces sp.]
MDPVQKALWYVEAHSRMGINLDQVAEASSVSPYHLTRVFAEMFGISIMRYARRRRLSEAAKQLAAEASDILSLAIDNGYGSHEAFSRAFKDEFGVTPESVRTHGLLPTLKLTEPIAMKSSPLPNLNPPRHETLPPLRLAGLVERYDCQSPAGIPDQWQRFFPYLGNIPNQVGKDAFGVCYNFDDTGKFDYLTGVVVKNQAGSPFGLVQLELPPHKYAVFSYGGHIAEIRAVISSIWSDALPKSGYEAVNGPTLEKYGPKFEPNTGLGGFEIWIAVK